MISLAVASLILTGKPAHKARQQSYILPLYDLVTSMSGSTLNANFCISTNWGPNNDFRTFRAFYVNGDTSHFSPNGNWIELTQNTGWAVSGNVVSFSCTFTNQSPSGTLWIEDFGGANDSPNGAEVSFVVAGFGMPQGAGHGSRPGALVPIVDRNPDSLGQNGHNVPISFNLYQPFGGSWGNSTPQFWQNNVPSAQPLPGGGWQSLPHVGLQSTNGGRQVTTTANAQTAAGYYIAAVQETYVPGESYNVHNSAWTEFSGIIRTYAAN